VGSDGTTANRQIPECIFWSIFTSLRKDSVGNYAWIWTVFLAPPSVSGAMGFANLRRKFSKTQKIGSRVVLNTSYGYKAIETVIDSTRVMGIRVTISCRYCIAFEVMLLFLV